MAHLKDGCLLFISCTASSLKQIPAFSEQLNSLLELHVIPELSNSHPFLRARVCTTKLTIYTLEALIRRFLSLSLSLSLCVCVWVCVCVCVCVCGCVCVCRCMFIGLLYL
jgi:hypothetical protein